MDNLHEIYGIIDRLSDEELDQVQEHINQRRMQPQIADEDPKTRAAALMAAFAKMREGLTEEQLDAIIEDMNSEYIEPLDPDEWAWLDDAEDKTG